MNTFDVKKRKIQSFKQFKGSALDDSRKETGEHDIVKKSSGKDRAGKKGYATLEQVSYDGQQINESLPSNISDWLKRAASEEQEKAAKNAARWVEKAGRRVCGGTTIGKSPQTLILDIKHQGSEIYINDDGEIKFEGKVVSSQKEMTAAIDAYIRSTPENRKYFKVEGEAVEPNKI